MTKESKEQKAIENKEEIRLSEPKQGGTVADLKEKGLSAWLKMDIFTRFVTAIMIPLILILLAAALIGKPYTIFFSMLQISAAIVALLLHQERIKVPQDKGWMKHAVLILAYALIVVSVASFAWGGNPAQQEKPQIDVSARAKLPYDVKDCAGLNKDTVSAAFAAAGFVNIRTEAVEGLSASETNRVGEIISVTVGGQTDFAKGQEMDKQAEVVIKHHAFKKYTLTVAVNFPKNFLFSKYDVDFKLNGISQGVLPHGEGKEFRFAVEPGEYILRFEKEGSTEIGGELKITVSADAIVALKIECYRNRVTVEDVTDSSEK